MSDMLQPLSEQEMVDHFMLGRALNQDRQVINALVRSDKENVATVNNHAEAFDHVQKYLGRASMMQTGGFALLAGLTVVTIALVLKYRRLERRISQLLRDGSKTEPTTRQ